MDQLDQNNAEFLWRRLQEDCPAWAVTIPLGVALVVIGLVFLFGRSQRLSRLLWSLAIVGAIACIYVPLALMLRPVFSWLVVVVPVLGIALFYTGAMYFADARSIHPLWAAFLGMLRCTVYALLTVVFLLPALQLYEETVTYPKILFLFDVSDSMLTKDDIPEPGQDASKLLRRQDKVVRFLTANFDGKKQMTPFLDRMTQVAPLSAYHFGSGLDESQVPMLKSGQTFSQQQAADFLMPDKKNVKLPDGLDEKDKAERLAKNNDLIDSLRSGTNYSASALQMMKLENNSYVQAVIIVGDGQSNLGTDEATKEFLARVNNPKQTIPVFTMGVGEFRQPVSIRIDDLQAPEITRPDDKMPVRVPVVGTGVSDEEFTVELDVTRIKDGETGKEIPEPKTFTLDPKRGKFKGAGDTLQDVVEFEVDVQELMKLKAADDKNGDLEGTWRIVARTPRHPREPFDKAEHVSAPVEVQVQKKKLRVLLFAGGATREYQFVRTLFYRESLEKRVDLSIFLQNAPGEANVDQDVERERFLDRFPDHLGEDDGKHLSLNDYDVIIAFDPDWTLLTPAQMNVVKEWVGNHSGGIIFVAGPVNTYHLARPGGRDLSGLLTVFPVVLKDSRLHGLGLPNAGLGHDASRPYVLHFTAAAKQFDFLKLDDADESPTGGWNKFFWGGAPPADEAAKDLKPRNGFYNYYPVDRLKPDSTVIATFAGPRESRINDGKEEQPFLVSMRYGNGKTIYVGSGEEWRLRRFAGYHERFWLKLARYVAAGATQQKKYGRILLARSAPTGSIPLEAQLKAANLLPLPADAHPTVYVKRLDEKNAKDEKATKQSFDLRAKPTDGDWQGWFNGSVRINEPGDYEFRIPIPGTAESLTHKLTVRRPNPELDNLRTNFDQLYLLSSESGPVLNRLAPETRDEVTRALQRSGKGGGRLFFTLDSADSIARCLQPQPPKRESVKGPMVDLWDRDFAALPRLVVRYFSGDAVDPSDRDASTNFELNALHLLIGLPLLIGALGGALLVTLRQFIAAAAFFGVGAVWALGVFACSLWATDIVWLPVRVDLSFVLIVGASLFAVEWLTRKLLRLA